MRFFTEFLTLKINNISLKYIFKHFSMYKHVNDISLLPPIGQQRENEDCICISSHSSSSMAAEFSQSLVKCAAASFECTLAFL